MGDVEELVSKIAAELAVAMQASRYRTVAVAVNPRGGHVVEFRSEYIEPDEIERLQARLAAVEAERDAARDKALEEAAKVCRDQIKVFSSTEYAVNQPVSSIGERLACATCAERIEALKGVGDGNR